MNLLTNISYSNRQIHENIILSFQMFIYQCIFSRHPIIKKLYNLKSSDPELSVLLAHQVIKFITLFKNTLE